VLQEALGGMMKLMANMDIVIIGARVAWFRALPPLPLYQYDDGYRQTFSIVPPLPLNLG
jgi:hypothetical protein